MVKSFWRAAALAGVLTACQTHDRPNINMIAEVNALTMTTADTLVVTRALSNFGANDTWLIANAPAFEMLNAQQQQACVDGTLDVEAPELVRIMPDSTIIDTRSYALEDLQNCAAGSYSISLVAPFRTAVEGGEHFTIRTSPATFVLTSPSPAVRAQH